MLIKTRASFEPCIELLQSPKLCHPCRGPFHSVPLCSWDTSYSSTLLLLLAHWIDKEYTEKSRLEQLSWEYRVGLTKSCRSSWSYWFMLTLYEIQVRYSNVPYLHKQCHKREVLPELTSWYSSVWEVRGICYNKGDLSDTTITYKTNTYAFRKSC